jgi:transcriptional regulator with XRE-family HTH domain
VFEIGTTLREARVRRNLTLQQVEEDTKIRVKYVQAMENEDFDLMPGATYVKGFLRTYATYLGLDPDVIIGEYASRGGSYQREIEPFGGVSMLGAPRSHRRRNTLVFIAVMCVLVLAVIYVLGMNGDDNQQPTTKPGALGIVSPSPSASAVASATPSASPTTAARTGVLRITARDGDCWLEVRRQSSGGDVLFSGTLPKGEGRVFIGKTLWMRLGNPGALGISIDGDKQPPITGTGPQDFLVKGGKMTRTG